jgi:hypothetical protein
MLGLPEYYPPGILLAVPPIFLPQRYAVALDVLKFNI